ncbi:hypothetical protein [Brevibacterium sp. HMSC07C04]|uniref:hypothetical protein n=1 Tax=Brevibacterium sp. HMSC07C04 TaxID=1581130 RepID=UPI0008A42C3C|nr:hypothetical protein [Brevibacterium sp. HMSC07C04]
MALSFHRIALAVSILISAAACFCFYSNFPFGPYGPREYNQYYVGVTTVPAIVAAGFIIATRAMRTMWAVILSLLLFTVLCTLAGMALYPSGPKWSIESVFLTLLYVALPTTASTTLIYAIAATTRWLYVEIRGSGSRS